MEPIKPALSWWKIAIYAACAALAAVAAFFIWSGSTSRPSPEDLRRAQNEQELDALHAEFGATSEPLGTQETKLDGANAKQQQPASARGAQESELDALAGS